MSHHRYYTRPRPVEAAQWDPSRPGDVIGLLANHGLSWERDDGGLVIEGSGMAYAIGPIDWVVIDEGEVEVFSDERFRARFEARTMRSSVTNTVAGHTGGSVVQAGDISGVDLRL